MRNFRKITASVFMVLVMLGIMCVSATTAYAAGNHITNIDIEVEIRDDGSAVITQHWTGEFHEGKENYLPIRTGDISISEFRVSDEDGEYTFVEDWDVGASFKKKAGKCGIVETDEGVELCFGITEYGHKEYTFSYVVTDFMKGYRDANGTNFMFINPEMSTFPTAGTIEIRMENGTPLSADNAGVWGFGYEGQVIFQGGRVLAYTERDLEDDNSMIIMLQLNKNLLNAKTSVDTTFEAVRQKAMEDSDYGHGGDDDDAKAALIMLGVVFGGGALLIGVAAYQSAKRKEEIKQFGDSVGDFADVPNGGDIEMTHYLARTFDVSKDDSLIVGALMLSMMNQRAIELYSREDIYGASQPTLELKLLKEPEGEPERKLFHILFAAAGSDGLLMEKELDDYAFENYEEIEKFISNVKSRGRKAFKNRGGFVKNAGNRIKDLSEIGKAELAQVIGLNKYLAESARMSERDIWEANLWQEYMVYATLFGIAEDVIEQLKFLYPDHVTVFDDYHHRYLWCYGYYHGMHNSMDKAIQEARTSGSGGSSSIGGGGGFSGGGVGGGSR